MRRWLPWFIMAGVLLLALGVSATGDRAPRTESDRVNAIAAEVRCPTCAGLSAVESDAAAAQAVRDEIRTRLRDGESDREIRAYLASRYGSDILLRPESSGVAGLVWALPVAGGIVAVASLVFTFRRWRRDGVEPTADDRARVEEALRS